jgi:serine protease Do
MNPEKLDAVLDRTTRMVGTGLVVDAGGYILTNEHVIGESENVWVTTDAGKVYPALVVGTDPRSDLAVLKIPATGLSPVAFSDRPLKRGQFAIALGNPYGLATAGQQALSVGVVSALDRSLPKLSKKENRLYSGLIQFTTQINPGSSGGPLFDLNGRVIGINTAVILPEKKANGIGFAIPVTEQLLANVACLKDGREVVYGYLGVSVSTPTPRERREMGLAEDVGVRVETVDKGSPAFGELRPEDFIVRLNDHPAVDSETFVRAVGAAPTERATEIEVSRDGKRMTVSVGLAKRPTAIAAVTKQNRRIRWEGLLLGPTPSNWQPTGATIATSGADSAAEPDRGLVVLAVNGKSRYAKQGVQEGDVITSIAGRSLLDVTDLQQVLNDLPPDRRAIKVAPRRGIVTATATSASARD